MIYGLYLSATGVITSSHQQDVIANNLANAETSGFKRELSLQEQRRVESQALHAADASNPTLDNIGGGELLAPSYIDQSQGQMEVSSNSFDTAIVGSGYLAVRDGDTTRYTRNGQFMIDHSGNLVTSVGQPVLDVQKKPINLAGFTQQELKINPDGSIQNGQDTLAQIGMFEPTDPQSIKPHGANLFSTTDATQMVPAKGKLMRNMKEGSNVDPTKELTRLMETQRLLEANANFIKTQDATLAKAVTDVGKID
ncbi:MAG: flagellar hook-basal body protein [Tepidisphaeraceae bacterium]